MPSITVYWRPFCGYCMTLKQELDRRGVDYEDVDIWEDRAEAEVVKAANDGDELVPTVRVDDRFLVNPAVEEVLAALDAA